MIKFNRSAMTVSALLGSAILLAGCSTTRFGASATSSAPPEQLQPVATSTVQSETLPPLGGSNAPQSGPGPYDTGTNVASVGADGTATNGSFSTLDNSGAPVPGSTRDLSGGISVQKLLGAWTVLSGADRCQLNLTQTTKPNTGRYRASTPGCVIPTLKGVASWQLAGTQVQLFDEAGTLIGTLIQSGDRFIGTLAGGVAVSMVG